MYRESDHKNIDYSEDPQEQRMLELIHQIKMYEHPPYIDTDMYCLRYPWNLLGGVSSGISVTWGWYWDTVILNKANELDLLRALCELKANET